MSSTVSLAQETAKEQATLAAVLRGKHVALATGVEAAARSGRPISAKDECEDGKLQLSVYAEKGGQFSEVVVDRNTGMVAKTDKITEGEDLKSAQSQSAAIAQARLSLAPALAKAPGANTGFSAVSATAALKKGQPVAEITLMKGTEFKTLTEPLA